MGDRTFAPRLRQQQPTNTSPLMLGGDLLQSLLVTQVQAAGELGGLRRVGHQMERNALVPKRFGVLPQQRLRSASSAPTCLIMASSTRPGNSRAISS